VHPRLIAFQKALDDLGWTDGRNVWIDYRFVVSDPNRTRAAAAELVGLKPDVLMAQSTPEIRALLELTRTGGDSDDRESQQHATPAGSECHLDG
jgi:ABC-type uncharacterized transport system substrate-binding protein